MEFYKENPIWRRRYILLVFRTTAPSNINYFWNFGLLCTILFSCFKFLRGCSLQCINVPSTAIGFRIVEHIMRDVSLWLAFFDTYILNGASFFFIVVYAHYF